MAQGTNAAKPEIAISNGKITTTSKAIADYFGKQHRDVLRKIESLIADCPQEWRLRNFTQTVEYRENPSGGAPIPSPIYEITRDGFSLLAMGFTGKRALQWKIAYINAFNAMEQALLPNVGTVTLTDSEASEMYQFLHLGEYLLRKDRLLPVETALRGVESPYSGRIHDLYAELGGMIPKHFSRLSKVCKQVCKGRYPSLA